ncbi:MAG: D-alanyl-D-alanine carboxypeptidase family protein [Clostridia bacterium]
MKKLVAIILAAAILMPHALAAPSAPEIPAPNAVLMERDTGRILYQKGAHDKLPPASVTKVMTLLLVMEALDTGKIKMTDMVTVSPHAASMGGSQVYLKAGEQMSMTDMLKATVIASGNDSATALAEHVSGSEEGFVSLMNARAKELKMNDTQFLNCTGLPADGHVSSAYDIAIMSAALLKHKEIKKYTTIWMDTLRGGAFGLANTNKLIRSYKGITGLKTGSTDAAKYCMAASAARNGMELIAAIMAAPTSKERFGSASKLLDFGFANFTLFDATRDFKESAVPVLLGTCKSVSAILGGSSRILIEKISAKDVKCAVELAKNVRAPVKAGQKLGEIKIYNGKTEISSVPIVAKTSVAKLTTGDIFWRLLAQSWMK